MNHEGIIDFFSYERPTPAEIYRRYRIIDLSKYPRLEWKDIFDAILNCRETQAVIIPREYGRKLLEVEGYSLGDYKRPWMIHWLYAPDVMLTTTRMTVGQSKYFRLNQAVREARWDYDVPHRGFGVLSPRTHVEILWSFLYLVEGYKLAEVGRDLIKITSGGGVDRTGSVPSVSKKEFHTVTLRNLSIDDFSILIQLYGDCTCLWPRYGLRRREERYKGGQVMMCRHAIAFYRVLEELGESERILPKPTGIMNLWFTLKQRTIIGEGKITRTQMNALLGMIAAYMKEIDLSPWG